MQNYYIYQFVSKVPTWSSMSFCKVAGSWIPIVPKFCMDVLSINGDGQGGQIFYGGTQKGCPNCKNLLYFGQQAK